MMRVSQRTDSFATWSGEQRGNEKAKSAVPQVMIWRESGKCKCGPSQPSEPCSVQLARLAHARSQSGLPGVGIVSNRNWGTSEGSACSLGCLCLLPLRYRGATGMPNLFRRAQLPAEGASQRALQDMQAVLPLDVPRLPSSA